LGKLAGKWEGRRGGVVEREVEDRWKLALTKIKS